MGDLIDLLKMFSAPTIVPVLIMLALVKIHIALFGTAALFNPLSQVIIVIIACIAILTVWKYMLKDVDMSL